MGERIFAAFKIVLYEDLPVMFAWMIAEVVM